MTHNNKSCIIAALTVTGLLMTQVCQAGTLEDITSLLIDNANWLTKLMWAACIIVGVSLLAASFTQFQIHRFNPKQVPLSTPIIYLLLGVLSIAIPFAERILKQEDSYYLQDHMTERAGSAIKILPPIERSKRK